MTEKRLPRGRQPQGERALTNAERQARYRARHQDKQLHRRPKDKRSRAQRWLDAVAELLALQAEYTAWHEGLLEALASTATAEALQPIVELDLGALAEIVPPRGCGLD